MNQKLLLHLAAAFLLGFLFIFACYAGLPADFNADHPQNIESATSLSFSQFLRLITNPFTPVWFYPPLTKYMGYVRPVQHLLLKVIYGVFGYELLPIHVIHAIGLGFLCALFLLLIHWATQSFLWAWMGVALYVSFPSNFILNISTFSVDFQYWVSLLSVGSLVCFGGLTFSDKKSKRVPLYFFGWIITTWLAIKWKSSEKILPFVCLCFLVVKTRFILSRLGAFRYGLVVATLLAMGILIVPLRPFNEWLKRFDPMKQSVAADVVTHKDQQTLSFSFKNLLQRTFYVPGGKFPLLSIKRGDFPDSFTENYGFFLGWLFWLGFLLLPLILSRAGPGNSGQTVRHALTLVAIWFSVIIAGFGSGAALHDKRLLNFALVPSVLLLFGTVGIVEHKWIPAGKKRIFRWIFVAFVVYTCGINFMDFLKQVAHFGGIQDVSVRAERDIFREVYQEEPDSLNLYTRHSETEKRFVLIDWYDLPQDWFEKAEEKLKKEKKLFFYSRDLNSKKIQRFREAGYEVKLWRTYDFLDARPLLFRTLKLLVKNFPRVVGRLGPFEEMTGRQVVVYLVETR